MKNIGPIVHFAEIQLVCRPAHKTRKAPPFEAGLVASLRGETIAFRRPCDGIGLAVCDE